MNVLLVGLFVSLLCVGVHYEALVVASKLATRGASHPRLRIVFGVVVALVAHFVESVIFAIAWSLTISAGEAELSLADPNFEDTLYFSIVCYTSLGFGDIVPLGPARILAGFEALLGLVMIAWTASFTYFQMERNWRD